MKYRLHKIVKLKHSDGTFNTYHAYIVLGKKDVDARGQLINNKLYKPPLNLTAHFQAEKGLIACIRDEFESASFICRFEIAKEGKYKDWPRFVISKIHGNFDRCSLSASKDFHLKDAIKEANIILKGRKCAVKQAAADYKAKRLLKL